MRWLIPALLLAMPAPAQAQTFPTFESGAGASVDLQGVSGEDGLVEVNGLVGGHFWMTRWPQSWDQARAGQVVGYDVVNTEDYIVMRLILNNGIWAIPPPPVEYSWPLRVDGVDRDMWLAGGPIGTGDPPATWVSGWGAVCTGASLPCQLAEDARFDGYHESFAWPVMLPDIGAVPGSTIELGAVNGGYLSSFVRPAFPRPDGIGALSRVDGVPGFKTGGEVLLGIAPSAVREDEVAYTTRAKLGPQGPNGSSTWTASLPAPTAPGSYTLHAKSCLGLLTDLRCDHQAVGLTV